MAHGPRWWASLASSAGWQRVLHLSCREIDTPARYGGDEVRRGLSPRGLSSEDARRVAQRISQRLSQDVENSAAIGQHRPFAEYSRDGATIEHILRPRQTKRSTMRSTAPPGRSPVFAIPIAEESSSFKTRGVAASICL